MQCCRRPGRRRIRSNIIGDADAARYAASLEVLLADRTNDAVLVMNVPTALASATEAADAVVATLATARSREPVPKPVLTVWVGEDQAAAAAFEAAGIPNFTTETAAIRGFMHLVRYREAIDALMETPPSLSADFVPDVDAARRVVAGVIAAGRSWLDPLEIGELFAAYAIPIVPALLARDAEEAVALAAPYFARNEAVVAKVLSPDIVHKSEVGGVRLNLTNAGALREAVTDILARARQLRPAAQLRGVTIHPMIVRPKAQELIVGIADDPTFGPVVAFGCGGTAVEVINDKALGLPPLDLKLARELIGRTRIPNCSPATAMSRPRPRGARAGAGQSRAACRRYRGTHGTRHQSAARRPRRRDRGRRPHSGRRGRKAGPNPRPFRHSSLSETMGAACRRAGRNRAAAAPDPPRG